MSENKLPQWAIDGLREAGLSVEGWEATVVFAISFIAFGASMHDEESPRAGSLMATSTITFWIAFVWMLCVWK